MITTQIGVSRCGVCPFYERGAVSVAVDFLAKAANRSGTCKFSARDQPYPSGRVGVKEEGPIPASCPLRQGVVTIRLDGGR